MAKKKLKSIHPGEILEKEFLKPMKITQYLRAKAINVPARRINEIVHGSRSISADTALRLGKFFRMEALSWMNLQSHYDLEVTRDKIGTELGKQVEPIAV